MPAPLPSHDKISLLRDRATMLAAVRTFFAQRAVVEVDTPLLSARAAVDVNIDLIPVTYAGYETRYLHSSPEYCMKRLLAADIGDIYQLSHVFRDAEHSHKHNPEFTMIEWYRVGMPFEQLINETIDVVRLFVGELSSITLTYREAVRRHTGIDYVRATPQMLEEFLKEKGVDSHLFDSDASKDDLLNVILGIFVEPHLGHGEICALTDYPATQAALAQTVVREDGEAVAERFELYHQGIELANGYHELPDPTEQLDRFQKANAARIVLGKKALPIDDNFIHALQIGFPDCCGVAVGFDRLMMLRHSKKDIADVLPFSWNEA